MHLKVSELASQYRFSVDTIYAWVRSGLIPNSCIVCLGASLRIDSDEFNRLLRAGKLYRPRRRKVEEQARHSRDVASSLGLSEDQHTTLRVRGERHHRFFGEDGRVAEDHPYSAGMKAIAR